VPLLGVDEIPRAGDRADLEVPDAGGRSHRPRERYHPVRLDLERAFERAGEPQVLEGGAPRSFAFADLKRDLSRELAVALVVDDGLYLSRIVLAVKPRHLDADHEVLASHGFAGGITPLGIGREHRRVELPGSELFGRGEFDRAFAS